MWEAERMWTPDWRKPRRGNLAKVGEGDRQSPWAHPTAPTDCCITGPKDRGPGSAAPTWQSQELTSLSWTKHPLCHVPACTGASAPDMKGHCCP